MLDWYPEPETFDEQHTAFIELDGVDVEVRGSFVHAEPAYGMPSGWLIESATIHSADPALHGVDVTPLMDADADALRRAEHALAYARTCWS